MNNRAPFPPPAAAVGGPWVLNYWEQETSDLEEEEEDELTLSGQRMFNV
jgi:hypothetical protein